MVLDPEIDGILIKVAENFRLDANLLRAICFTESSGNTWKTRFEPAISIDKYILNAQYFADKLGITTLTEMMHQRMSFGLMQVMGFKARELQFTEDLPMLCIPNLGLFYGAKEVRRLSDKYEDEADIVAAYNAGSARKLESGVYVNETYVDRVYSFLRELRKI